MNYITWDINPVLVTLGPLKVHWYGLLFALGFIIGFQIMQWIFKRENKNTDDLDSLLWFLIIGVIIGARLGHVVFYDPAYYFSNPLSILKIWEGGLASHGGAIGALIGLYLFKRSRKEYSYLWLLDRLAIPTALLATFIRTGNLFNSEIVGIHTSVPWAVIFDRVDNLPRHPAQVYEALSYLFIFIVLFILYKATKIKHKSGMLFGILLSFVFIARLLIEFVKSKQEAYSSDLLLSTGQLLSIPFILAGLLLIAFAMSKKSN
ncbi:MAG TPA: prolipoprotein diacylglyceryl transferase [Leucothrix mucor]|nr:prolipoprotein diacylglyceryl transferase [Leucothrix mucor]